MVLFMPSTALVLKSKYQGSALQSKRRVPTVLENPGKSLNLKNKTPGLEGPRKAIEDQQHNSVKHPETESLLCLL